MKKNSNNPVVKRILKALGFKKLIDIARLCGITQQNLNGYMDRETLTELVEHELSERNINLDWIKTGQGEMMAGVNTENDKMTNIVREALIPYTSTAKFSPSGPPPDVQDAIKYAITAFKILTSGTGYASALRENITWFDEAVDDKKRMRKLEDDMESLKERLLASGTLSSK